MNRAAPTKEDLTGKHFGRLTILGRSDKRGSRGARTVPLWECQCDCGTITYKATDTLTNPDVSMCTECLKTYAPEKMREKAGFIDGTQVTKLKLGATASTNASGVRGVYYDRKTGKYRARLKFKGRILSFGSYSKLEDAIKAREAAEKEYYAKYLS